MRCAALPILLSVAVAVTGLAAQSASPAGTIAIVRADGKLLPLAALRGQRWRSLSRDTSGHGSRLTPEATQLPATGWTLWPRDGAPAVDFRLRGRAALEYECRTSEGFATTLRDRTGPDIEPATVIGLAVRGNIPIVRPANIAGETDLETAELKGFLASSILAMEEGRFNDPRGAARVGTDISPALRRRSPLHFDLLLHHRQSSQDWYYFEASKEYEGTGLGYEGHGWFSAAGTDAEFHEFTTGLYGTAPEPVPTPPTALLGIVDRDPAIWIMAEYTNVDVLFELLRVGDDPPNALQHLFTISANHCIP